VRGATAELKNGMIKVFAGNGISGQMLPASMTGGFGKVAPFFPCSACNLSVPK
jgi:hypothetical protein